MNAARRGSRVARHWEIGAVEEVEIATPTVLGCAARWAMPRGVAGLIMTPTTAPTIVNLTKVTRSEAGTGRIGHVRGMW